MIIVISPIYITSYSIISTADADCYHQYSPIITIVTIIISAATARDSLHDILCYVWSLGLIRCSQRTANS